MATASSTGTISVCGVTHNVIKLAKPNGRQCRNEKATTNAENILMKEDRQSPEVITAMRGVAVQIKVEATNE